MDNRNTIAKNAVVLTLSGLTVKIIGFFFRIPLGRLLTASGMGDYSPAYEIYSFALLFSTAGLPVAVAKMIAERNAVGELDNSKKVFRISRLLMAAMGLAGFFVLFIFSDEISRLIGLKTSSMSIKATSFALIFVPLLAAYREETGDLSEPICIGGGTYARAMPHIAAFGPMLPGMPQANSRPVSPSSQAISEASRRVTPAWQESVSPSTDTWRSPSLSATMTPR